MSGADGPFTVPISARWPDMDQNGHMSTTAYLGWAEDSRMRYFVSAGFPMERFTELAIGPVIQEDHLRYLREMRLLDEGTIELRMAGLASDGSRFRMRNDIVRADGRPAVSITSSGGWLDLAARRLTPPPVELLEVLQRLAPTDDFEDLPSIQAS